MKKGIKRSLFLILTLTLVLGAVLSGCGSKSGLADKQVFRMNIVSEPPSLDPGTAQDNASFTVLIGMYDGLTRLNKDGKAEKTIAKSWDISEDKKTWTFHLRDDVKWSNGDKVTAHDFEYAWKRALDPKLASPYAYQLYYLVGAEDYNSGKTKDPGTIGVKALDDTTLEVHLVNPTPYFDSLVSFFTYYPLDEKAIGSNPNWAADAKTMVTNGPFLLDQWNHNDTIVLKKNPDYYDAKNVKLSEVDMSMVQEASTEMNMFNTGQLDWNGSPVGEVPLDVIPQLKKDGKLHITGKASIYYYEFNVTQKPFDNVKIRKALSMGISRQDLVDKVTQANQLPAYGVVTPGIAGEKKSFREEHPDTAYFKEDYAEAKKLLQEGLQEEGLSAWPDNVTLMYNTSEGHKKIAQAIADMWKKNLGIDVKLENQEWKVFLKTRQNLNYQIARAGWGADYNDPMTYIDLFKSTSGNNDTGWKNADYDALVDKAYASGDAKTRMDAMAAAEKLLIQDNMVIMPIYYYTSVWQQNEKVKNVIMDYAGNMDYTRGYIEN